ncbi:MAG: V-type ATP synthase subunit E [Lachnospiraceae bacterium]|nr:V-type ATP synthase subunit E [Lachnospiraceae bacterium]
MNTDIKIKHFMDISIQAAGQQAADIMDKYKAGLDEMFENHKKISSEAAKETLQSKKTLIRRNIKKDCSDRETELKKQLTSTNLKYKQKIFNEVNELLNDFKASSEYFDYLCECIKYATDFAKGDDINIYIDPDDSSLKEKLETALHITVNINEFPFIGGIRAVIPSKNILIDETFELKLSELKENYRINY